MKTLVVITGPTGSGKTDLAIDLALRLGCEIISADSRQIYRGIPICTAQPSPEQLAAVPHHLVGTLPLDADYSAAQFEHDVLTLLPDLWLRNDYAILCGGSMMYIDAVTQGIDDLPTISPSVRRQVLDIYTYGGLDAVRTLLLELDSDSYNRVDPLNPRRNIHALEITLQAGVPASTLLTGQAKERPFHIKRFHIEMPREQLFDRINRRVEAMVHAGLIDEAKAMYPRRHLNSLNTVGLKELFAHFDGLMDLPTTLARIAKNTRVYAKKQLTWLARPGRPLSTPVTSATDIITHLIS